MKKVSVIIPMYGVERFIAATVQSVLNQTYQNFEVLIIDDGSCDKSVEICQQFSDLRIQIISQVNKGPSGARNTGIRHAQGEYLAFLDGDDLWLPEKLEKHVAHLENSQEVGVSFSCSAFINEAGQYLDTYQKPMLEGIEPSYLIYENPVGNGSAAVVRREVFEAIKFQDSRHSSTDYFYFDESLDRSEELECWLRIGIKTDWQIKGIPEVLNLYRVNSNGLSADLLKQLNAWEKVIEKTRSYAPELITKWEEEARAHHLLYLARRAIRLRKGLLAVEFVNRALVCHWLIIFKQPSRTIFRSIAAYSVWLLPAHLYNQIEELASKAIGAMQIRRILQGKSS